jgi:hypothetical protein
MCDYVNKWQNGKRGVEAVGNRVGQDLKQLGPTRLPLFDEFQPRRRSSGRNLPCGPNRLRIILHSAIGNIDCDSHEVRNQFSQVPGRSGWYSMHVVELIREIEQGLGPHSIMLASVHARPPVLTAAEGYRGGLRPGDHGRRGVPDSVFLGPRGRLHGRRSRCCPIALSGRANSSGRDHLMVLACQITAMTAKDLLTFEIDLSGKSALVTGGGHCVGQARARSWRPPEPRSLSTISTLSVPRRLLGSSKTSQETATSVRRHGLRRRSRGCRRQRRRHSCQERRKCRDIEHHDEHVP